MLQATFRQLETFVLVAETGSFAKAADRLGVSPAAVSEQVRTLEKKFGHALFDRRPGTSPLLNERGAALLHKAPALLESAMDVANLAVQSTAEIYKVRVGTGYYILEELFLPNLARFQREHPRTQIEFVPVTSKQEALRESMAGNLDLAYLAVPATARASAAPYIAIAKPCLVARPDHPAAHWMPGCGWPLPIIMPLAGSHYDRVITQSLSDNGIDDLDVVTRAQHPTTIVNLAVEGIGAAFVLREHVAKALEKNLLVDLGVAFPPLYREAFRRPGALEVDYLRDVDQFALRLLRSDNSAYRTAEPVDCL